MSSEVPLDFDQLGAMKAEFAQTTRETSVAPHAAATGEATADGRPATEDRADEKSARSLNAFAAEVAAIGVRLAGQLDEGGATYTGGVPAGPEARESVASYQATIADLFGFKVR